MKTNEDRSAELFDAVTGIRGDIVEEAGTHSFARPDGGRGKHRRLAPVLAAAAALALIITGGILIMPKTKPVSGETGGASASPSKYALVSAEYPKMAPYPDEAKFYDEVTGEFDSEGFDKQWYAWRESRQRQSGQSVGRVAGFDDFTKKSAAQLLSDADGANRIYSPLNVYMALGMLAETTGGDSRGQVLDLLGEKDIASLRRNASALWNANYQNDGANVSVLAGSLWLNESVGFREGTLRSLADNYYASSFRGQPGSAELDEALRGWMNEQTGGLLKEQVSGIRLNPQTVAALVTTVYFRSKWSDEFSPRLTEEDTFHGANGDDVCDFMHQTGSKNYYRGERFGAVRQELEAGGSMSFLLPDEGVTVDDLLADSEALDFIVTSGEGWKNSKFVTVNESVPKFDASSQLDLCDSLRALGVSDVFDAQTADFSPLSDDAEGVFLSGVQHGARVTIDEEGCTAAAYTVMMACGAAMPPEEKVDFVLDRPFLFTISSADGQTLFVGVINTMA